MNNYQLELLQQSQASYSCRLMQSACIPMLNCAACTCVQCIMPKAIFHPRCIIFQLNIFIAYMYS